MIYIYISKDIEEQEIITVIADYLHIEENEVCVINATKKDFELGEKETVASVFVFNMSGDFPYLLSIYSKQISEYEDSDYKLARFVSNKLGIDYLANNLKSQATDFLRFDKDGNCTLVYADEDILDDEDRIVIIESY